MSERQNQYNVGLDKTPANYVPLSAAELPRAQRRRLSRSRQHRLRGPQLQLGADV